MRARRWSPLLACLIGCGGSATSHDGGAGGGGGGENDGGPPDVGSPDVLPEVPPSGTQLHLRVTDAKTGLTIPAKVSLWKDDKPLAFGNEKDGPFCSGMGTSLFEIGSGGALATWNGIALYRGEATIPVDVEWAVSGPPCSKDIKQKIPFGTYTVRASRGSEYEIGEATVELRAMQGVVDVNLPLARTVDTGGYLAADMHIHTRDGSGDSSVGAAERVKAEVSVGVEVLVSSDHDFLIDLGEPLRALWPDPATAPAVTVVGDETSPGMGHFNVFPLTADKSKPFGGAVPKTEVSSLTSKALFERMHGLPGSPLIQVNHPRLGYAAYFDSDVCGKGGGWKDHGRIPDCALTFDAIEVLSGFLGCDTKIRQTLDDWYALLGFGVVAAAFGNSDSHYTSGILGGFPRTYVRVADDTIAGFKEEDFVRGLRERAAVATTGPFLTMTADGVHREGDMFTNKSGKVLIKLRLQTPTWIKVDVLRLKVDGADVKTWDVTASPGLFEVEETVTLGADAFVNAEVQGKEVLPTWLVGDFLATTRAVSGDLICPNSDGVGGMVPFAVTNPVLVDVDGDGIFHARNQPIMLPEPLDIWIPFPDGSPDCDPRNGPIK